MSATAADEPCLADTDDSGAHVVSEGAGIECAVGPVDTLDVATVNGAASTGVAAADGAGVRVCMC